MEPSPYREECHLAEYQDPADSCEYYGKNISWAVFGDSHSVEIAYALADKLKRDDIGLKHFTFSGCKPSYKEPGSFSECSKWYNETVGYILNDKKIRNVVFNHRFTKGLLGGGGYEYPETYTPILTDEVTRITKNIDELFL